MSPEMQWPDKKRRLKTTITDSTKPDWCDLKWLASMTGQDDGIVAEYFIKAANRLVDSVVENRKGNADDGLFMPIAYLYRHSTELLLKDIIQLGIEIGVINAAESAAIVLHKEHSLNALWSLAAIGLERRWPEANKEVLENTKMVITDLHNMDPDGQGFRYSRDTKERMTHIRYPDSVLLSEFRDTMAGVFNLLDSCRGEFISDLSEMEK
jgi:hypothetical protein